MANKETLSNIYKAARKVESLIDGREVPDSEPLFADIDIKQPEPIADMVKRLVRTAISNQAAADDYETFEEANDFDTGEDSSLRTEYELADESIDFGTPANTAPEADTIDNPDTSTTTETTPDTNNETTSTEPQVTTNA